MVSNAPCPQPADPPPPFSEVESVGAPHFQNHAHEETAPEYSLYPANVSSFELQMLGSVMNTKEKYICGDLLDGRFFLLGTTSGLDVIDLSLPAELQVPKRIIDFVRFKQIRVVQTGKYDAVLALCGKNSHLRCYSVSSIRSSISSMSRRDPPELPLRSRRVVYSRDRARSMDSIFEPDITSPDRLTHAAGGDPPSTMETMDEETELPPGDATLAEQSNNGASALPPTEPERTPRTKSRHKRHSSHTFARNFFTQGINANESGLVFRPEFVKLPNTRMTNLFAVGQGLVRTYVCALSKQNIFLFELDYGDATGLTKPEFVHTRTYWLPQTPRYLELAMQGELLTDIIAMFQTDAILIGVEDARVRDVFIDRRLKQPTDESLRKDCSGWNTFSQLPFLPTINPENLSDSFTIPPPYNLAVNEDPETLLSPIAVADFETLENPDVSGSTSLFFASFGRRSMIVDCKGRPYSTVVFTWTTSPFHVEFVNVDGAEAYVIGFGQDMVEVRSFATGRLVESVVRGVGVQFLARGRKNVQEVIWSCAFDKGNRGCKGVCLYRLQGPRPR